ncbi:hypothetical protein CMV_005793 [Castanea mollissima]|uniref:Uncharacterized protein n=1 Tax=Castanea mollissima TaxID=60419 RepID=A0A8J4RKV3_9ROSI|nr:hypothetical protein CMV_005793 [Castanea mollissima]
MTLAGLHCRGVTPTAINAFVRGVGITRRDNSIINLDRLKYHIREELNKAAPRTMVVLRPLKVVITNLAADSIINLDAKRWPDAQIDDAYGFTRSALYTENSFCWCKYAFPKKCTKVILADDKETILEIQAEYDPVKKTKPKGVLHWVVAPSPRVDPLMVEVRLFDKLFLSENPAELDDWLADLNPQPKVFERLGYFVVDRDSTPGKLVFNRTVTLRDNYSKGAHTKESANALVKTIKMTFGEAPLALVIAMASDKDHVGFARGFLSGGELEAVLLTEADIAGGNSQTTSASLLRDCWIQASKELGIDIVHDGTT